MVAFLKFAAEKAGFVSSAIFRIKHVFRLAVPGDTLLQRARYLLDFHFFASALISFL